ncbi:PepSY-associated TM helix domain-containing protein [Maribellus sp. YY47]|uniref:PepSY-associated TM helix domain-containing protein n=1 Tax=Maribellus sp. YY47 TaxID=2929486 RepID=UPI002000D2A6|nr:PepSY-associated TM helix domain-containing protein [Maribellus sp. YY47]MCK3685297.1 PepSY-associated TM helix domain-containing protein [Maribellus sp. YY47]
MKIRKLLRVLHRDFGYFIVGMTIVYALSGIFLNHRHDFNPDYNIIVEDFKFPVQQDGNYTADDIREILSEQSYNLSYKKHYLNSDGLIKVFIESGEAVMDPETGEGRFQLLERRPLIFEMNKLHKATLGTTWKWVSDIMAVVLLFVAVSGLFILKGKRGFTRWGWWLTIAGFIVPLVFAMLYI